MTPIKNIIIVQGIGGSRADFVSGWLGCLSGFIDNQWIIDHETGKSSILGNFLKEVHGRSGADALDIVLSNHNYKIDSGAEFVLSGTCTLSDIQNHIKEDQKSQIKILVIDTDDTDATEIFWQNVVKTFMVEFRVGGFLEEGQYYGIDHDLSFKKIDINDANRCDYLKNWINGYHYRPSPRAKGLEQVIIKYDDLFRAGGSRLLCDALELHAQSYNHARWDQHLPWAVPPRSLHRWGEYWNKADIISGKNPKDFEI